MENVEAMLKNINFSRFSKVQDSLKRDLIMKYDTRRQLLTDEELDTVVAAGTDVVAGPTPGIFNTSDTKFEP